MKIIASKTAAALIQLGERQVRNQKIKVAVSERLQSDS